MKDTLRRIFERALFELGGQPISLLWVSRLIIALVAVSLLARYVKRFLKRQLLPRLGIDGGNGEAMATLVGIGTATFGYLVILQATGIDLSSLAVIIGGLGVGVGFGLQDITKNSLSGLTVLIERKLRVGDFIEFDDVTGYIEEISIRSTVIRTLDGSEVMIPNSQIAEGRIVNWSYRNSSGRVEAKVGVAYGSDPVLVTETLLEAAYSLPEVLRDPPPKVIFAGFGDSSLNFKLWVWIDRIDRRVYVQSNLTFAVEYYLRYRKVTIPFPQLDLWVRSPRTNGDRPNLAASGDNLPALDPEAIAPPPESTEDSSEDTLRGWLSQISYFQDFDELKMRSLIEMGFRQYPDTSEVLVRQGETVRQFCIVLSGAVDAYRELKKGEQYLFTFRAGEYFGDLPMMLNIPSPATLRAASNTLLFVVSAKGFQCMLRDYPTIAEDIARELSKRKEVLEAYQQEWREADLDDKSRENPVIWIQQRLKRLFSASFM